MLAEEEGAKEEENLGVKRRLGRVSWREDKKGGSLLQKRVLQTDTKRS